MTRNVVFMVAPPFELLDLTGPFSVFMEANAALTKKPYSLQIISTAKEKALASSAGLSLTPQVHYKDFGKAIDTLLVIGGPGAMGPYREEVLQWHFWIIRKQRLCDTVNQVWTPLNCRFGEPPLQAFLQNGLHASGSHVASARPHSSPALL